MRAFFLDHPLGAIGLAVLAWNVAHLGYVYWWRARGRKIQRKTGHNNFPNDLEKILKL